MAKSGALHLRRGIVESYRRYAYCVGLVGLVKVFLGSSADRNPAQLGSDFHHTGRRSFRCCLALLTHKPMGAARLRCSFPTKSARVPELWPLMRTYHEPIYTSLV